MHFSIIGPIRQQQTFAAGTSIRERERIIEAYGVGRWRKRKGVAQVRLSDGSIRMAQVHWYEATGIGRRELKIKRYVHR